MVAPAWMVIFLLPKKCLISWDIGCLNCLSSFMSRCWFVRSWWWVWWRRVLPLSPSPHKTLLPGRPLGVAQPQQPASIRSGKLKEQGQCDWGSLLIHSVGEREPWGAQLCVYFCLGVCCKALHPVVFLCSPSIKYLLSAYSDRARLAYVLVIIFFLPHGNKMWARVPERILCGPGK